MIGDGYGSLWRCRFRCLGLAALLLVSTGAFAEEWLIAKPDYAWSFPQDHWARAGYKTEWWYFTGHLKAKTGRRFGYQFTFFRVGLLPEKPKLDSAWAANNLIMGHAAISDPGRNRHLFSEVFYRAMPLLGGFGAFPDTLIAWSRGPAGTAQKWTLSWNGAAFDFAMADRAQGMAFALRTQPEKPLIFEGPNGYSRKGQGNSAASQYYSFTRLATVGTVIVGGDTLAVTGESWMDKEFGSDQLGPAQAGWDWFSLQLADRREVMLYLMRNKDGTVDAARGTLVSATGGARYLTQADFSVTATRTWTSPQTDARYPAEWAVQVAGQTWTVRPEMADQENRGERLKGLFYWEGAVTVMNSAGAQIGKGYVELTGYGTGTRPGI